MKKIKKHIHGITAALLFFVGGTTLLLLAGFTIPLPLPEEKALIMEFPESIAITIGNDVDSDGSKNNSGEKSNSADKLLHQNLENSHYVKSGETTHNPTDNNTDKINGLFNNPFGDNFGDNNGDNDNPYGNGDDNTPGDIAGKLDAGRKVTKVNPVLQDNQFGKVVFEITVDSKGYVVDVRLLNTTCNECVSAAREAVKKWKFDAILGSSLQIGKVTIDIEQK